tara:strand:+ start:1019 stop:1726 length:708 start_codon:yes stop_codon:yes gene_type:complete
MSFEIIGQNASNVVSNVYVDTAHNIAVNDSALNTTLTTLNGKVTACDTGAVVVSSSALPSGAATEASLAALSGNVTTCDTGAVVVSSSALPSGGATSALQTSGNSDLTTLAGCVVGTTLTVSSSGSSALASTNTVLASSVSVSDGATETSASVDANTAQAVQVFGSLTDSSGNIRIQISADNSNWFDDSENSIYVDTSGFFSKNLKMVGARYVRLIYSNASGSAQTYTANCSIKA